MKRIIFALALLLAAPVYAYDNMWEDFDGGCFTRGSVGAGTCTTDGSPWPDSFVTQAGGTGCGASSGRPSTCNNNRIWSGGGSGEVAAFAECAGSPSGGKCFKGIYGGEDDENAFAPQGDNPPSTAGFFMSMYVRIDGIDTTPKCSVGGNGAQKWGRTTPPDIQMKRNCTFFVEDPTAGQNVCGVPNVDISTYNGQWFRVDRWHAPGQCQIWVTEPDGVTVHTSNLVNYSGSSIGGTFTGVPGNRSDPQAYTYSVFSDDFCFGTSIADRTGFCASAGPPPDTTPPIVNDNTLPKFPNGDIAVFMHLGTSEPSTCKYDTSPGIAYASMASTFATTGSSAHKTEISTPTCGTYTRYARCQDAAGNPTTSDTVITWDVKCDNPAIITESFDANGPPGWFDESWTINTGTPLKEGTGRIRAHWNDTEANEPSGDCGSATCGTARHHLPAGDILDVTIWRRHNASWASTDRHLVYGLTNADVTGTDCDQTNPADGACYPGLSFTHGTAYIDEINGSMRCLYQDQASAGGGFISPDNSGTTQFVAGDTEWHKLRGQFNYTTGNINCWFDDELVFTSSQLVRREGPTQQWNQVLWGPSISSGAATGAENVFGDYMLVWNRDALADILPQEPPPTGSVRRGIRARRGPR